MAGRGGWPGRVFGGVGSGRFGLNWVICGEVLKEVVIVMGLGMCGISGNFFRCIT